MTTGAGTIALPTATDRFYTIPARTKDFGLAAEKVTPGEDLQGVEPNSERPIELFLSSP